MQHQPPASNAHHTPHLPRPRPRPPKASGSDTAAFRDIFHGTLGFGSYRQQRCGARRLGSRIDGRGKCGDTNDGGGGGSSRKTAVQYEDGEGEDGGKEDGGDGSGGEDPGVVDGDGMVGEDGVGGGTRDAEERGREEIPAPLGDEKHSARRSTRDGVWYRSYRSRRCADVSHERHADHDDDPKGSSESAEREDHHPPREEAGTHYETLDVGREASLDEYGIRSWYREAKRSTAEAR
ncbi:hypothetical protein MMC19_001918 [Ptychographa xylographoides]|nr:hypothetical protein [Ptychographa xylographoides]